MIGLISSESDHASRNISEHLIESCGFERSKVAGMECWKKERAALFRIDTPLISGEIVDSWGLEAIYFLSKHKSAQGVPALTTHSLGNWTGEAKMGGRPMELSFAAPVEMLGIISAIEKIKLEGFEKTYEATHHGPMLKTPSLFVEMGGNDDSIKNKKVAQRLAEAVDTAIFGQKPTPSKIVIGIGGTHYPKKFTELALQRGYAFSHIMPKHAILNEDGSDNLFMLEQAIRRSSIAPEAAVIDWKSVNAVIKERILNKLGEIGLDYERA
ncbi:MAG: hypothetical protein KGH59_02165 [Candidatus Micrarchaeota archaeon]|nr:hypothetical protein [Candidatus Micrarchaeota archaeon]